MNTLADLRRWAADAPPGTTVPAAALVELLNDLDDEAPAPVVDAQPSSWRERLWSVPAETRLGVPEVAEAFARPKSWVYSHTGPKAQDPLPHRKLEGSVMFAAGELRAWIRDREQVVHGGPMESTPLERRLTAS